MPLLHLQPEQARHVYGVMRHISQAIQEEAGHLSSMASMLAANWTGPSSDAFQGQAQAAITTLQAMAEELHHLSSRMEQKVDAWETVDMQGAAALQGLGYTPLQPVPMPVPPAQPPAPPVSPPPTQPPPTPPEQHPPSPTPGTSPPHTPPPAVNPPPATHPPAPDNPPETGSPTPGGDDAGLEAGVGAGVGAGVVAGSVAAGTVDGTAVPSDPLPGTQPGSWSERIAALERVEAEIDRLEAQPERTAAENARLEELRQKRAELQAQIQQGIGGAGLDGANNPFPEGECTWYATSRRNIYPAVSGHAKFWADQAAAAGMDVGAVPVKGSVMVWQPDVHGADARFGHVSFVERVEPLGNGAYRVYYTDNHNMNPASPRSVVISPGEIGVSFIY